MLRESKVDFELLECRCPSVISESDVKHFAELVIKRRVKCRVKRRIKWFVNEHISCTLEYRTLLMIQRTR